jgi:hypothetical protein
MVWVVLQPQAPVPLVVALPEQWPVRPQVEPPLVALLQEQLPPEGLQSVVLLPIAPQCQPRTHQLVKQVLVEPPTWLQQLPTLLLATWEPSRAPHQMLVWAWWPPVTPQE